MNKTFFENVVKLATKKCDKRIVELIKQKFKNTAEEEHDYYMEFNEKDPRLTVKDLELMMGIFFDCKWEATFYLANGDHGNAVVVQYVS